MASSTKTRSEARADASALCSAAKGAALGSGSRRDRVASRHPAHAPRTDAGALIRRRRNGVHRPLRRADASGHPSRQLAPDRGHAVSRRCVPLKLRAAARGGDAGRGRRRRALAAAALPRSTSSPPPIPAIMRYLEQAVASQMARQAIHAATLGQFDCEQRVATLLVELALRTGVSSASGGVAFELPFNRTDIADYLGLNPDTLSRIMSRLKAAGLIGHTERNRAVVRDFPALAARSPAAQSLLEISRRQSNRNLARRGALTGLLRRLPARRSPRRHSRRECARPRRRARPRRSRTRSPLASSGP